MSHVANMWRRGASQRLRRKERASEDDAFAALQQEGVLMPLFFHNRPRLIVSSVQPALPRTDEEVRMALRQLPHYRVMLHNDDYNAMDHVVLALVRTVPQLTPQRATAVMLEAHRHGIAQVIICPKETAEFYREGLEHYGLTSTIEPA